MEIDSKIKAYRFVGYAAVCFSTVSIVSICIMLPMLYNYMGTIKQHAHADLEHCKAQIKDTWTEVYHMGAQPLNTNHTRVARQASQPGDDGEKGKAGCDGEAGVGGEKGMCPKYCALDGGVFFEDGTTRR
ncbi:unnamed protein product, partial [Mesorhabditis spiculigera]